MLPACFGAGPYMHAIHSQQQTLPKHAEKVELEHGKKHVDAGHPRRPLGSHHKAPPRIVAF
jgi:hypothetical protein